MQQKERIGKASKLTGQGQTSKGPAEVLAPVPGAAPDIIRPRCLSPQCNARRERGEKRPNGEPIGDPLELMRLRYDFTDGVVAETLFCKDCRAMINATLYGFDRTILGGPAKPKLDVKVPEPPKPTDPA